MKTYQVGDKVKEKHGERIGRIVEVIPGAFGSVLFEVHVTNGERLPFDPTFKEYELERIRC